MICTGEVIFGQVEQSANPGYSDVKSGRWGQFSCNQLFLVHKPDIRNLQGRFHMYDRLL